MENALKFEHDGQKLTITVSGRIDSNNALEIESAIKEHLKDVTRVKIDCTSLEYISSAGLRVLLKIKKIVNNVVLTNVSNEIYDIFELTGFTEMLEIRKGIRQISVKGCEVIGTGSNAVVYRTDPETIVKVILSKDALEEINNERRLARTAFVLGVPTAIAYDVVQTEEGYYGSAFELLNADSYQRLLASGEMTVDQIAQMCVEMLKTVHTRIPRAGALPSKKEFEMERLPRIKEKELLSAEVWEKLNAMYEAIPENPHMLHGDFHIKNIMIQNGESLMIDMDTICTGDPIFEFSGMYVSYCAFSEFEPENTMEFFGITKETADELFHQIVDRYCQDMDVDRELLVRKARILAYTRLLDYCATGRHMPPERREKCFPFVKKHLEELLPTVEDLSSHISY